MALFSFAKKQVEESKDPEALYSKFLEYHKQNNDKEAFRYLLAAAEQGHVSAQNNLGVYYLQGKGTEKNDAEAVKWFEKAAEKGYAEAQRNLGSAYGMGIGGLKKDFEKTTQLYELAAAGGSQKAAAKLQEMRKAGLAAPDITGEMFEKLEARAKTKDNEAILLTALCYRDGKGIGRNKSQFFARVIAAAQNGYEPAKRLLNTLDPVEILNCGHSNYIPGCYGTAFHFYYAAAKLGLGEAWAYVARCFMEGNGREKDLSKAKWCIEQGEVSGDPEFYIALGKIYVSNNEVKKAEACFASAVEKGCVSGLLHLGKLYFQENELHDLDKSIHYYTKAAEAENEEAMFFLSDVYAQSRVS